MLIKQMKHSAHNHNSTTTETAVLLNNLQHQKILQHDKRIKHNVTFAQTPRKMEGMYSGMWYQSIRNMLLTNFSDVHTLETVSLRPFRASREGPLFTSDWLDFSVEHWSKYVKHFSKESAYGGDVQGRVAELLQGYIDSSLERKRMEMGDYRGEESLRERWNQMLVNHRLAVAAVQNTIAIVPIRVKTSTQYSYSHTLQIIATITSLWRNHFPRIVIAGVTPTEHRTFLEIRETLHDHLHLLSNVELVYVHMEGSVQDWKNVPKMAMVEFQRAVRESRRLNINNGADITNGTDVVTNRTILVAATDNIEYKSDSKIDFVESWLGTTPQHWKHIYFTEPDSILQTRETALPSLVEKLNNGSILTAHRLNPLPHIRQFSDIVDAAIQSNDTALLQHVRGIVLPELDPFTKITSLNPDESSCCDQGNYFPANRDNPNTRLRARIDHGCRGPFDLCGFGKEFDQNNETSILEAHKFLTAYKFIALEEGYGTGAPLIHAHQRVCIVQKEVCL